MKLFRFSIIAVFLLALSVGSVKADVSIGVSANNDGIKSFYLSIGEQYRVPEAEVIVVREKKIPDDQLPVVFFIARHAKVEPGVVVKLRADGKSWMDITLHFGLTSAIYYVGFQKDPGPPYGKAWGYFRNHKRDDWKTIRLADDDIINFVNVKFMSERYGYSVDEVIKMRDKGESFVNVNSKIKKHKEGKNSQSKHADADNSADNKPGKGKGKQK